MSLFWNNYTKWWYQTQQRHNLNNKLKLKIRHVYCVIEWPVNAMRAKDEQITWVCHYKVLAVYKTLSGKKELYYIFQILYYSITYSKTF